MIFIRKWGKIIFLEGPLSLFYKIIIYSEIWVANFAVLKNQNFFAVRWIFLNLEYKYNKQ